MSQRPVSMNGSMNGLLKDDRGVMMIACLFFSFVWIGLVWFILGVGTAINYHENLQMAADASAFAGAVYDARGMNLLAMINVIMGVVLSALIIAHIIQAIAFAALSADCISCISAAWCSCLCGYAKCPGDCSDMKSVDNGVKDVDNAVHEILRVCHTVEVGIAIAWPWVAAGKSTTSVPHTALVPLTTSFSYSQVPSSGNIAAATKIPLSFGGPDPNPNRYGLPVTSDSYQDLCRVASLDVGNLYGVLPGSIGGIIGGALNAIGNWACDSGQDSSLPTYAIEGIGAAFAATCIPFYGPGLFIGGPIPGALPGDMKDVGAGNHSQSPMKLINTKMGTDYFGVWSTAIGNYKEGRTPNRVQIAALEAKSGTRVVPKLADDADMGVTKAEFYYDPKPGDTVSKETTIPTSGGVPIPNCMWNMRWRARLRRYHNFPGPLGAELSLEAALNNVGGGLAGAAIAKLLGGGTIVGLDPADTKVDSEHNKPAKNIYH